MAEPSCKKCQGSGFIFKEIDDITYSIPCSCQDKEKFTALFQSAGIPEIYKNRCTFDNFQIIKDNPSIKEAFEVAKKYSEEYPAFEKGKPNGLLFMGSCGVGKTHLAVAILNEIMFKKKSPAKFVDLNELYREIRASYGNNDFSEYDILVPYVEAELLLIDELGCISSPWAQDTLLYIITQRYNKFLPTLLTTNYPDTSDGKEDSLIERIGTRCRSRLYEMCRTVVMNGDDFRKRKKF
jgi:DNA replication protein DnaC